MRTIQVVAAAVVLLAAACTEAPEPTATRSADSPLAPSFSVEVAVPPARSSICTAYERDLSVLAAKLEAEPRNEQVAAETAALQAITADVCN